MQVAHEIQVPEDLGQLEMAFEFQDPGVQAYYDLRTGDVLYVGADIGDFGESERIEAEPQRFARIEPVPSYVGYQWMVGFTETVSEGRLRGRLEGALAGMRPFFHFKQALHFDPVVRERWFKYHGELMRAYIERWLADVREGESEAGGADDEDDRDED